jgi:hypothetical protein
MKGSKIRKVMRITIINRDTTVTTDVPDDSDILTTLEAIKGLLVSSGFHPATVDQHILADEWGLDCDE